MQKPRGGSKAPLAGVCLLALGGASACAQEALRGALAGAATANAVQVAGTSIGYYNLLLGDTAWRFSTSTSLSYNDNTLDSSSNPQGDLIIAPSVNTQVHWPVSLRNSLDVGIDVGYSQYVEHSEMSDFFINPGSGLSFDIYLDNIRINLHDRISVSQYGYQNPGAGGDQNLVSLQNSAGVTASMDLDKGQVGIGYDHSSFAALSGSESDSANSSDNISANVGFRVEPEWLVGVEAGTSIITSGSQSGAADTNGAVTPSAIQYSAGVFANVVISEYLNGRLDAGYSIYDNTQAGSGSSNGSGFDFTASLTHRLNKWLTYSLSAGRSTDLAAFGQAQNRIFVQFNPSWVLIRNFSLNTPVSWQTGTAVTTGPGQPNDTYTQYTFGVNVGHPLTQKLSSSISWQFAQEDGAGGSASYSDMIIGLNFTYQF